MTNAVTPPIEQGRNNTGVDSFRSSNVNVSGNPIDGNWKNNPAPAPSSEIYDQGQGQFSELDLNNLVLPYENVLQKFYNYTWNFSLYALSSESYSLFLENPDVQVQQHIIARSGVNGRYQLADVVINHTGPATPGQTTNYTLNTISLTIFENAGMNLLDDIIMLSNSLGYKKLMDVPLILELDFVGFDENGIPQNIPDTNRKWGVMINNITASTNQSGGTMSYVLSLTSKRSLQSTVDNWALPEPYTCTANNFGDFIKDFESKLNEMADEQRGYLRFVNDAFNNGKYYEIALPDELANMQIQHDSRQSVEVGNTKSGAEGSKLFTWKPGTPLSRIVDDVLDSTTPAFSTTNNAGNRVFVNIIPTATYVCLDPIRNQHAYKYKYYIVKYNIGDVISTDDLTPERFNVNYFINNAEKITDPSTNSPKLHIKRYDYQFTGKNTEITNLDLKFDQQFHIAVTRNPQSYIDKQNIGGTHSSDDIEIGNKLYKSNDPTINQQIWNRQVELQRKQETQTLSDAEKQELRDAQNRTNSIVEKASNNIEGTTGDDMSLSNTLPIYIEDYRNQYNLTEVATNGISGSIDIDNIPVDVVNMSNSGGTVNDNSSDVELNRRITRSNYYNRSFMTSLDMEVVGDPYWLGWSDWSFITYLNKVIAGEPIDINDTDKGTANFLTSEAYLLLNLRPNVGISEETGVLDFTTPSIFNQTLYRINKITSTFSNDGSFKQRINAAMVIRSLKKTETDTGNYNGENVDG